MNFQERDYQQKNRTENCLKTEGDAVPRGQSADELFEVTGLVRYQN